MSPTPPPRAPPRPPPLSARVRSAVRAGSVVAAPAANLSDFRVLREGAGDSLRAVAAWAAERQRPALAAANPCARDNGGCAQLCLWDGARGRCACPHGDLAPDRRNCTRGYLPGSAPRAPRSPALARTHPPHSAAYASFLMYSRVTKIDSVHMLDEKNLNSPYPPIQSQ